MSEHLNQSLFGAAGLRGDAAFQRLSQSLRLRERLAASGLFGRAGTTRLTLLAGVVALGVAGATGVAIQHQRVQALAAATGEIASLSRVLAHQAERTIQATELVQQALLDRIGAVETPEQFREALRGQDIHELMRQRIQDLPQVDAVTAIDVDGNLINFSRYWPIPRVNIADRDYYKALRAEPGLGFFVSVPVRNRGDGKWTAYLARAVTNQEGAFLGLILIGLDLDYFERLYADVEHGERSVSMMRDDGVLLARHPRVERDANPVPRLRDGMRRARAVGEGITYRVDSAFDDRVRLVALQPLHRYPIGVSVTTPQDSALAAWRQQALLLGGAALLLELALGGLGLLVARQLRAQRALADANLARGHAEAELAVAWELAEAERRARAQDARQALALNSMSQGLCMFDSAHRLVLSNQRFEAMFHLPPRAVVPGMPYEEVLCRILASAAPEEVRAVEALKERTRAFLEGDRAVAFFHDHPDGRSWSICLVPGEEAGWVTTFEDVTERRKAEAQVAHMARHDALTGLPNRLLFRERLEAALARGRRGDQFAVLCLDLDRFKAVNDTLGHPVGDALLRAVADRLRANCRPTDTIARLGGDEFAIIQDGLDQPHHATLLASRVIDSISRPYRIEGHDIGIGTSIGIAIIPTDGDDPATLLKKADLALYRAKLNRGSYCFFEPRMEQAAQARRATEGALRTALAEERFSVHYQPILDLQSLHLVGFEAMLRWDDPVRGQVAPAEFIPLAEEIGLMPRLDAWVLRQACADAMAWPAPLRLSVNLSPTHFRGDGPAELVRAALEASGLPPGRLEVEITESGRLDPGPEVQAMMRALKALGVRIALDDFGTGHAALTHLRSFPVDSVKIDRAFLADTENRDRGLAIVEAVGTLCRRLGLSSTVEGIETEAELLELRHGACDNAQGHLFGKALPASEVPAMCRAMLPRERALAAD